MLGSFVSHLFLLHIRRLRSMHSLSGRRVLYSRPIDTVTRFIVLSYLTGYQESMIKYVKHA